MNNYTQRKPIKNFSVIIGLGKTGLSCARFLARNHIPYAITDTRENPPGLEQMEQHLESTPVHLGGISQKLIEQATEVIVSPGITPEECETICSFLPRDCQLIGDIEVFARYVDAPVLAITGSNGKSTVTTLVGEMAKQAGLKVKVGGNLGTPALDLLDGEPADLYVLELSSAQLELTESLKLKVACILNLCEDHMDRYTEFNDYVAAKQRIYKNAEYAVFNKDDQLTYPNPTLKGSAFLNGEPGPDEFGLRQIKDSWYLAFGLQNLLDTAELKIMGRHNWLNALAALAIGHAANFPMSAMLQVLKNFTGLNHRCQWVAKRCQMNWVNDSKGTNPGATVAALEGLGHMQAHKLILIAGGEGKNADFSILKDPVHQYVDLLILIGKDAKEINTKLKGATRIIHANSLEDAVKLAASHAIMDSTVLLSPACASFDMFRNFEHRGEVFTQAVLDLPL